MLDPEEEAIVAQVVTKLAGPPTVWKRDAKVRGWSGSYSWLDHEELLSEATIACMNTDVLTGATSPGAFHERLRTKLIDTQKTESEWRNERIAPIELADIGDDGTAYATGDDGELVTHGRIDTSVADNAPKHVPGGRSRLLDRFESMTNDEFVAWGEKKLGRAWAKKLDLRTFLFGSSTEQSKLWTKYATGKRVNGGKRLVIDGIPPTEDDFQETLEEEWRARYRWDSNGRHPLVVNADSQTIEVARILRQPVQ